MSPTEKLNPRAAAAWLVLFSMLASLVRVGIYYWFLHATGLDIHQDAATVGAAVVLMAR